MPSYLQRLDDYNHYLETPQNIKEANIIKEGWLGSTDPKPDTAWTDQQAVDAIIGSMPASRQAYVKKLVGDNYMTLLQLMLQHPDDFEDAWGYVGQAVIENMQEKENGLYTNAPVSGAFDKVLRDKLSQNGGVQIANPIGLVPTRGFVASKIIPKVKETQGANTSAPPMEWNPPELDPSEENPSMWNYLAPALAVGAPMALLGGLGGGKAGMGLLGLSLLGGLGYGYARQNGWLQGWEPLDNFANTVNNWEPVKNITGSINNWVNGGTAPSTRTQTNSNTTRATASAPATTQTPAPTQVTTQAPVQTPAPAPAQTPPAPTAAPAQTPSAQTQAPAQAPPAQTQTPAPTNAVSFKPSKAPVSPGNGGYSTTFERYA